MKIVRAKVVPIRLELIEPLETAHGKLSERCGAVLMLTDASGTTGCGEALPLPGFGLENADHARRALESSAAQMLGLEFRDFDSALSAALESTKDAPTARAAIDVAFHDLAARMAGVDLAAFLNPTRRIRVEVNALLGEADSTALAAAARDAVRHGFETLKLKVGRRDLTGDLERLAAVRGAVGKRPRIRVDANGGWSETEAAAALREFAAYDVEFVEQPVPAAEVDSLARLRAHSPIRIAADEAVRNEETAAALLEAEAVDILVLKPAAVGGLRAAGRIAERAQRAGVAVVVTSFLDSSLGIAAAAHLAAALPPSSFAAGLGTAARLRDDLCTPSTPRNGTIALPRAMGLTGLGVQPHADALRRCADGVPQEYIA